MSSSTETVDDRPARSSCAALRVGAQVGVVGIVALVAAYGLWWYGDRHQEFDLKIYFHAVRWWAGGHPLYDFSQPDPIQGSLGFTYPPFAAVLMYPMAWLSLGSVIAINWVAGSAALVITTAWLVRPVAVRHHWPVWFAVCLAVPLTAVLEPIRENATFGQIDLYLALMVLADLLLLAPRRHPLTGIGIGLATAIKLTPGIFIGYLLVTRRYRAAATAAGATAAATAIAAAITPTASWRYWTDLLWQTSRIGHLAELGNQSLLGMLSRLLHEDPAGTAAWLAVIIPIGGYGLWRAARAARRGDELAGLTLAGLVGALVSPVSWQHHLYWFVPALVVLVDAAASRGRRGRLWYAGLAAVVWGAVTISVISFVDYRWLSRQSLDTLPGMLSGDGYTLLMLALLPALPIRPAPGPGSPGGTGSPGGAGARAGAVSFPGTPGAPDGVDAREAAGRTDALGRTDARAEPF